VIAADMAHIFTSEAGGGSAFAGLQTWPLATARGIFTGAAVREGGSRAPRSRIVAIEQTVNRGGRVARNGNCRVGDERDHIGQSEPVIIVAQSGAFELLKIELRPKGMAIPGTVGDNTKS